MDVSLVIPAFTEQRLIDRTLAMLKPQMGHLLEAVVVDDGSYPPLNEKKIEKVRYHRVERSPVHRGASFARNIGAYVAVGDYLLFCDASIHIVPDAVESIIAAMNILNRAGEERIILTGLWKGLQSIHDDAWKDMDTWIGSIRKQGILTDEDDPHAMVVNPDHQFCLMSRSVFNDVGGYDEEVFRKWGFQSQDFTMRVLKSGGYVYSRIKRVTTGRLLMLFHEYHDADRDTDRGMAQFVEKWGEPFTTQMLHRFMRESNARRSQ